MMVRPFVKVSQFAWLKSPTDHLGHQPLHWLQFFQRIGVPAKVVRVVWTT